MILQPHQNLLRPELLISGQQLKSKLLEPSGSISALYFDGSDDYISLANCSDLDTPTELTVMFCVYFDTITHLRGIISSLVSPGLTGWALATLSTTGFRFYSNAASIQIDVAGIIVTDKWYNISFTYSQTDDTGQFYVNGDAAHAPIVDAGSINGVGNSIVIGRLYTNVNSNYFHGKIRNVKIFTRRLSADEIKRACNSSEFDTRDLVGWWKLNEGYGTSTSIRDWSACVNTGTMNNFTGIPWINFGIK